ncbi:MAG: alpha/beta fold hydrolase [Actinomycetota bacterium]
MTARRIAATLASLSLVATLAACDADPKPAARATTTPGTPSPSPALTTAPPTSVDPVSLPALMRKTYDGRDLRTVSVLGRNSAYTRYAVRFRSGRLRISGIMNVPAGRGPFPVLILNHGYIDPAIYTTGRGLAREQDYLARRGYVVLHVDYRNHAQSDDDPNYELNLRLGYTEDVINAVYAVKESTLPYLDGERVGMLGRSMGGGVTFNALVVQPDLVKAAVVYAPVSSDVVDNFDRWIRRMGDRRVLAQRIAARFGSPEKNPEFWRNVSPRTFFDRISVPLIMHHGTDDESVPLPWSRETYAALKQAGKDARLYIYEGEHHAFGPQWAESMRRTVRFLDRYLKA